MKFRLALVLALPLLAAAKPNIVYILADDLGWNDVGYHGSEIRTPHIDALAREGVVLDRYYAFPQCSPTRAALLTGRSPIRQGIDTPIGPNGGLPLDEHLLPETLRAAGYQTVLTGKWHLGLERAASHPHRRGFDQAYGHLGPSIDYFTHIWLGGLDWHRNGRALREVGYATDLIANEAVERIRARDASAPLFLYVSFNAPHAPLQVPDIYLDRYPGLEPPNRRLYAAMVSAMDDGVGRILEALDSEGIAEETIVVWSSDNGGNPRAGASNAPLRGGKGSAFEGGIRVPCAIRWPGELRGGSRLAQLFTAQDWFQTLASAGGVEPRNTMPFDGVDMWPALRGGVRVDRGDTVVGLGGNYAIFRDGWKLVEFTPRARAGSAPTRHLFRIKEDPHEERDLLATRPELAAELAAGIQAIPRAPSVSRDTEPTDPGPRGRRRGAPEQGWSEETRPPWADTAIPN